MATLTEIIEKHGLTVESAFVPWSRSRNFKPDAKVSDRSLNWKVTLKVNGRDVLTADYSAGIAHCPSYNAKGVRTGFDGFTVDEAERITSECETGVARVGNVGRFYGKAIEPKTEDVVYSLLMDATSLDSPTFEDWAAECGYDPDSRKAKKIYRECLEIALRLRNHLGESALVELREAAQDY